MGRPFSGVISKCSYCKKELKMSESTFNRNRNHFCSKKCEAYSRRKWHLNNYGYLQSRFNGKILKQHRFVMEKYLGRELSKEECVHHINGIKTDNRIDNLQIMNFREHNLHHESYKNFRKDA